MNPLGISVLYLLQQRIPDLYEALPSSASLVYNSVVLPQEDACEHVLLSSDEFDRNAVGIPIHTHQHYNLEKLVSSDHNCSHKKAAWF